MTGLDKRLNAFRPDLADERLRGRVTAGRFATGHPACVASPVLDLRNAPRPDASIDTQLLFGDTVTVFEDIEGFAWIQADGDGYVGYAAAADLAAPGPAATHVVRVPRTFAYREPDMKRPATRALSLGSRLAIVDTAETRGTLYALLATGEALIASHLCPQREAVTDYVTTAELLEHAPYLWGGASAFGTDCSGLVQLSMRMAGKTVLRDTDMQAATVGSPLAIPDDLSGLKRGDLVFWKGHVAIMLDGDNIIHANGHTMTVAREPLSAAVDRIAYLYGRPTGLRRP